MDYIVMLVHGNDHVIAFNEFHDIVLGNDAGTLYLGRDPSEMGIVIRNNFWHGLYGPERQHAVYLDDGASFHTIEGNVFFDMEGYSGAMHVNGGHHVTFRNNIVVKYATHPFVFQPWREVMWTAWLNSDLWRVRLIDDIDVASPPFCGRYPDVATIFATPYDLGANLATNNVIMKDGDPGFVDMENLDLRLREDSPVWTNLPGFQPIPFEKIGLLDGRPRADAGPDQRVEVMTDVLLNGSDSYDPGGLPLTFAWEQVSGPESVGVGISNAPTASFVPQLSGRYEFFLAVSNGVSGASDPVVVEVGAPDDTPPRLVSARAGRDATSILLEFSEPLARGENEGGAGFPANYAVDCGVLVTGVVHHSDERYVSILTSPLLENVVHTVDIRNVSDQARIANRISNTLTSVLFSASEPARGYLSHLLHLGDSYEDRIAGGSITNDYFADDGGEASLRPVTGDSWHPPGGGSNLVWSPLRRENGTWGEGEFDSSVQYWAVAIFCPTTRSARLVAQHDERVRAWMDGEVVLSADVGGETSGPVFSLPEGWSQFLFKLQGQPDENHFKVRFASPDGKDLHELRWRYELPPPLSDENGDTLPDAWQQGFFGHGEGIAWGPGGDWDRDGFTNFSEHLAGTDPLRADSLLVVSHEEHRVGTDEIVLRWTSTPGRTYAVERCTDPLTGNFETVRDGIPATPPENEFACACAEWPRAFFRVRLVVHQ